jgi:L-asparaginase
VKLILVATGGTIASLPDPATGAVRPAIAPEDLVRLTALETGFEIEVIEVARVNGWNVTPDTMLAVVARLGERLADPCVAGAIVTHGTDTVEETAFLAELLVDSAKPVVFTAAMRTGAELGADGPRNLANAARVAGSAAAAGWGALVVMNDEVHCARWCVKTDSFRPSALSSPGYGPVGYVTPERVRITSAPERFVLQPPLRFDAAVPIVTTYSGMPSRAIASVLEATGARGLVVQGTGAGNVPGSIEPALRETVDAGMVVAIATRVLTGGTVPIYGGPGGGVTLRDAGVVSAGGLTAAKARLLLMVALAGGTDPARAAQLFRACVQQLAPGAFGAA